MKKTLAIIALAAVAALSLTGCGNNKKQAPTPDEIQEMEVALADSVLAEIDALVDNYIDVSGKCFVPLGFTLTAEEKMVKPDYLLEPSYANSLVTRSQKLNALAIYIIERFIREAYDMPVDETEAAIAKLAVDLNLNVNQDVITEKIPVSERVAEEYKFFKDRGEDTYFWQLQHAVVAEFMYILAQNPKVFFSRITDAEWFAFADKAELELDVLRKLSKYDNNIATVLKQIDMDQSKPLDEELDRLRSRDYAQQFFAANKKRFVDIRNMLIK